MSSILDEKKALILNGSWIVIGEKTVRQALSDLCAGAFQALDFDHGYMIPTPWEKWIKLPINPGDDGIRSAHAVIRAPRVLIAVNYKQVEVKRKKCSLKNLAALHKNTCALTGRKLKPSEMSREHVVPRSKGGRDGWDNEVLAHRDINSRRGDRPYAEVGLKPPVIPAAPKEAPVKIANTLGIPEWDLILGKNP